MSLGELTASLRQPEYEACIAACTACWAACEVCADACTSEPDSAALARCIRLDRECAQACHTAALAMLRGGEFVAETCALCARLCEACAIECERHGHDHCAACALACRDCAQECRRMAA